MRTLKKALALVLVLAMALGTVGSAAQFDDVDAEYVYAEAISMLADLAVLTGDGDGNYRPEATITRAEVCQVLFKSLTGLESADTYAGVSKFGDVAADAWYSGAINYVTELGIVEGYPIEEGQTLPSFLPEKEITFAEAVTMIVRALGIDFDDDGQSKDLSYPVGYLAEAGLDGILDGVELSADDPAYRGAVAQMTANMILEGTFKRAGKIWIGGGIQSSGGYSYQTIAQKVFNMYEIEGVVTGVDGYGTASSDEIDVMFADGTTETYENVSADKTILGTAITGWVDEVDGDEFLRSAVINDDTMIVTAMVADISAEWDDDDMSAEFNAIVGSYVAGDMEGDYEIGLTNENDTGDEDDYTFDAMYYANYGEMDIPSDYYLAEYMISLAELEVATTVTLISNDGDDESIEYFLFDLYEYAEIDEISDDEIELTEEMIPTSVNDSYAWGTPFTVEETILGTEDFYILDREITTEYDSMEEGDMVFMYKDAVSEEAILYPVEALEGYYTDYDDRTDVITIDEIEYLAFYDDMTFENGDILTNNDIEASIAPMFGFIFDAAGAEEAFSTENLYLVTDYSYEDDRNGETYYLTAYDYEGTEIEFEIDEDLIDDAADDLFDTVANSYDMIFNNPDGITESAEGYFIAELDIDEDDMMVMDIIPVDDDADVDQAAIGGDIDEYDGGSLVKLAGSNYRINSGSLSFFYTMDGGDLDEVTTYMGEFPYIDETLDAIVDLYEDGGDLVAGLYAASPDGKAAGEDMYGIILSHQIRGSTADSDDAYLRLTMLSGGEIVTYDTEDAAKGDIEDLADMIGREAEIGDERFAIDYNTDVVFFDVDADGLIVLDGDADITTFRAAPMYDGVADEYEDLSIYYGIVAEVDIDDSTARFSLYNDTEMLGDGALEQIFNDAAAIEPTLEVSDVFELAADVAYYTIDGTAYDDASIGKATAIRTMENMSDPMRTALIVLNGDGELESVFYYADDMAGLESPWGP